MDNRKNKTILRSAAALVIAAAFMTTGCVNRIRSWLPVDKNAIDQRNSQTTAAAETALPSAAASTTTTTTATTTTTTTTSTTTTTTTTTATTTTTTARKTTTTTKTQAPESLNGQEIVDYAMQFLGTPYVYGGNSLTKGVDCSGFTKLVYSHFGISLPRTAAAQHRKGTVISEDEALPGDLCTTVYEAGSQYTGHAAIYIGNGQVINALPEEGVVITDIYTLYGEYTFQRIFNNTCGQ